MRSYIFTEREHQTLKAWLKSKQKPEDTACLDMVLSRVRNFKRLRNDVLLYHMVCEKLGIATQKV